MRRVFRPSSKSSYRQGNQAKILDTHSRSREKGKENNSIIREHAAPDFPAWISLVEISKSSFRVLYLSV